MSQWLCTLYTWALGVTEQSAVRHCCTVGADAIGPIFSHESNSVSAGVFIITNAILCLLWCKICRQDLFWLLVRLTLHCTLIISCFLCRRCRFVIWYRGSGSRLAQWYSAGLRTGRTGVRVPAGTGNFSPPCPCQLWGSSSLLSIGYQVLFPWV
jgi:hypothetical protein